MRAAIGQVGGYWRPLAAVARLQEELGELAELLISLPPHIEPHGADPAERWPSERSERLASELADLWIITTALSDQFLGRVAEPGSSPPRTPPPPDLLGGLVAAAGRIARIVNHYDGPKTPRTFEGWISLSDAVAELHRALAEVAHAHEVDLAAAVGAKLDAIPTLDSGRFRSGEHDPSTAASLERFRAFQKPHPAGATPEERARLWGSPEWSSDPSPDSFASNVRAVVADLTSFTKAAPWEGLEGYLVSGPAFASTALLEEWVARLLADITARDPAGERSAVARPGTANVRTDTLRGRGPSEQRLTFNGLDLLVTVLSPLYDPSDSRHSPAGTFVLLEPGDRVRDLHDTCRRV